jgi:Amt family ammonium transporter
VECSNDSTFNLISDPFHSYAFAYGGDDGGDKTFVGNKNFFLRGDDIRYENWFFQFAFACALSSIVAGTIAERTQMKAYLLYSTFLVAFCYPVVSLHI